MASTVLADARSTAQDEAAPDRAAQDRAAAAPLAAFQLYRGEAGALSPTGAGLIVTPNLDHLRMLRASRALRRAYRSADVIINDSRFLDRFAIRGEALCLPGSELAPDMLEALRPGARVVLIGGDEAVHAYLARTYPRLELTLLQPSMGYVKRAGERRRLAREVLLARPDCVFVCTGAPQSELFAAQLKRSGCRATILCCGSAFNFLSGAQARAPVSLRLIGAEWFWRCLREPRTRRRYAADAAFLLRHLRAFLALRAQGEASFDHFVLRAR